MADCRRQFSQSEEDFRLSMYNRMNENTPSGVFLFFIEGMKQKSCKYIESFVKWL